MGRASIELALPARQIVLLDTTTIIAYLARGAEGEAISDIAAYLIDEMVRTGRNSAVVSTVTVMEILVRPLRLGARQAHQHIVDFLSNFPNLHLLNVDFRVAEEAASLRATYNLPAPDALIIASGLVAGAGHLVSNDAEWRRKLAPISQRVKVLYLEDHLAFQ